MGVDFGRHLQDLAIREALPHGRLDCAIRASLIRNQLAQPAERLGIRGRAHGVDVETRRPEGFLQLRRRVDDVQHGEACVSLFGKGNAVRQRAA